MKGTCMTHAPSGEGMGMTPTPCSEGIAVMATPHRPLTLTQALVVANGLHAAKEALSAAIMDCTDDPTADTLLLAHAELSGRTRELEALIHAVAPTTVQENDDRAAYLIRQAIHAGEGFGTVAELAAEAYRRECELRAGWGVA